MTSRLHQKYLLPFTALALLLIMATGFLLYRQNFSISLKPSPIPNLAIPSTWKTYRNTRVGIEIKHPSTWKEVGPLTKDDNTLVYLISDKIFGETPGDGNNYKVLISALDTLPCDTDLEVKIPCSNVVIAGRNAYKTDKWPGVFSSITYFIPGKNKIFAIDFNPTNTSKASYKNYEEQSKIFDQMLSSFKFIEQDKTIRGTYVNTKYHFSIASTLDRTMTPLIDAEHGFVSPNILFFVSDSNTCLGDCPQSGKPIPITVAGISAHRIDGTLGEIGGNTPQHFIEYEFKRDNKYITFTLYATTDKTGVSKSPNGLWEISTQDKELFERIMSTLKFTK